MESSGYTVEIVSNHKCLLGEGPVWDEKRNSIYWLDVLRGEIREYSYLDEKEKVISVGQMVGAIALCTDDSFIGGLEKGIYFIDRNTAELKPIVSPEEHLPENRSNDGKCDPSGRFWIGTMAKDEDAHAGALYMIDKDLTITKKIADTTISNGLAWTSDKKRFYFIDSPDRGVDAFNYDDATGEIHNRRNVILFGEDDGFPDGMTIDTEGMLWIAHWDGWQVSRWNPDTGEKMVSIRLPVSRPSSCTFGGDNLGDLFITTAQKGLSAEELQRQPDAGKLFVVRNVGAMGVEGERFRV